MLTHTCEHRPLITDAKLYRMPSYDCCLAVSNTHTRDHIHRKCITIIIMQVFIFITYKHVAMCSGPSDSKTYAPLYYYRYFFNFFFFLSPVVFHCAYVFNRFSRISRVPPSKHGVHRPCYLAPVKTRSAKRTHARVCVCVMCIVYVYAHTHNTHAHALTRAIV